MTEQWKTEALSTIQTIFRDQFLNDSLVITESTSPVDIEEWDSLAHVNLLLATEMAFNVRFTAEEMGNIDGVRALLGTIDSKRVELR
jgi:acyl carrier protein